LSVLTLTQEETTQAPETGVGRPPRARSDVAPLQRLVDTLAAALGRPVLLDDAELRLLAHSSQGEREVDRARLIAILERQTPPDVVRHLERSGMRRLTAPQQLPGDEEIGLRPRLCCPVRWNGATHGYLWLVLHDGEAPTPSELEECRTTAGDVAALLHEEEFVVHSSRRLQRRLLVGLLTGGPDEVERLTTELKQLELLAPGLRLAALVGRVREAEGAAVPDEVRSALDAALRQCSRALPPHHALAGMHDELAVLALAVPPERDQREVARLAQQFRKHLCAALAEYPGWTPIVGVGPFVDDVAELRGSFEPARATARVAARITDRGPVAHWVELGVFRALAAIPPEQVAALTDIHDGLAALAEVPTGDSLLHTAETYLDHGADARAAATALHLHRSSLYYRLNKCEEIAGIDLRDGGDRLSFHLALKLARLSGHLDRVGAPA
jgi:PucR-like helix-turn-helix protein/diguanylate cyclase with GGDEF domain